MDLTTQYSFAGDYTGIHVVKRNRSIELPLILFLVEAINKAVTDVAKFDAGSSISFLQLLPLLILAQMSGLLLPSQTRTLAATISQPRI